MSDLVSRMRDCWKRIDPTECDDDPVAMAQASALLAEGAAEIERQREEIAKYKAWSRSTDPSPAIQAVIAELEALDTECTASGLMWVREHCLGLLRGQLPPLPDTSHIYRHQACCFRYCPHPEICKGYASGCITVTGATS